MFQIDPRNGLWTIKHLSCDASFQLTGDNILNATQRITCPNCAIPIKTQDLKDAVSNLIFFQEYIDRASKKFDDLSVLDWHIDLPITIIEEEETP